MDRGAWLFWVLIASLCGASAFFAAGAEGQRRDVRAASVTLESGAVVSLAEVVDGDTLLVATEAGEKVPVRLLGVKAFDTKLEKDVTKTYGQAAVDKLRVELEGKPIRVLLHSTPKDKHGRTIATLFVEEHDVGLDLVKSGLALVYTVYPFPTMQIYLTAQELARADRRGLWSNPAAVLRADALSAEWRRQAP
ncbi:MAG: thermonuclease family protein [Polyangiaceae bacterium]|nr:thermonuclease family protein [Polyangiaceae bacterium]